MNRVHERRHTRRPIDVNYAGGAKFAPLARGLMCYALAPQEGVTLALPGPSGCVSQLVESHLTVPL